jgi:hypothetical protein
LVRRSGHSSNHPGSAGGKRHCLPCACVPPSTWPRPHDRWRVSFPSPPAGRTEKRVREATGGVGPASDAREGNGGWFMTCCPSLPLLSVVGCSVAVDVCRRHLVSLSFLYLSSGTLLPPSYTNTRTYAHEKQEASVCSVLPLLPRVLAPATAGLPARTLPAGCTTTPFLPTGALERQAISRFGPARRPPMQHASCAHTAKSTPLAAESTV